MILYITSDRHKSDLDTTAEELKVVINKACVEKQSLNKFIAAELKNITSLSYLIIDQDVITDNEGSLNENIEALSVMYNNLKVLLYTHNKNDTYSVAHKENYTIINGESKDVSEEIKAFLSDKLSKETKSENIWIAVAGVSKGCGCTSTAMQLANYINQYESSVCYVEANESNHLSILAEHKGFDKLDEDHYMYNNLTYRKDKLDNTVRFLIFDLGELTKQKLVVYDKCMIKILVSDSKPYRLDDTDKYINSLNFNKINLIFNHALDDEKEPIRNRYIEVEGVKVLFNEYNPNLFSVYQSGYKEIMKDYINIIDAPEDKRKKTKQKGRKLRSIRKSMVAALAIFLVIASMFLNVFFVNIYSNNRKEDNIIFSDPVKIINNIDRIKVSMASGIDTTEDITTESSTEEHLVDIVDNNNIQPNSNVPPADNNSNSGTDSRTDTQSTAAQITTETTTEATTEASHQQESTTERTIDTTPTISISGYHGQIYNGKNVKSIISKISSAGYSYSILLRDNSITCDTGLIDNSCSYLCQVSGNSLTFIEQ